MVKGDKIGNVTVRSLWITLELMCNSETYTALLVPQAVDVPKQLLDDAPVKDT